MHRIRELGGEPPSRVIQGNPIGLLHDESAIGPSGKLEQGAVHRPSASLCRVLDHRYAVLCREILYAANVGWITVQVRNNDRVDTAPYDVAHRVNVRTQRRRINVIQPNLYSCPDRHRSEVDARVRRKCNG